MHELSGLYAALATPYTADGEIDPPSISKLLQFVRAQKLEGVYVGGSTGEALLQSAAEREAVLRQVAGECSGKLACIGHVGALSTRESRYLAKVCAEEGYAAISAIPPVYYPYSTQAIFAYYQSIADACSGLPLLVYNIPAMSNVNFTLTDIEKLFSIPNVCGLKQTSMNMYNMEQIHRLFPSKLLLNGYDEVFLSGIAAGAEGGIGSTFNIMGWRYRRIRRLFQEGSVAPALEAQSQCNSVIDRLIKAGVFAAIKYILSEMGVIATPSIREPLMPIDRKYHQEFAEIARDLMGEFESGAFA